MVRKSKKKSKRPSARRSPIIYSESDTSSDASIAELIAELDVSSDSSSEESSSNSAATRKPRRKNKRKSNKRKSNKKKSSNITAKTSSLEHRRQALIKKEAKRAHNLERVRNRTVRIGKADTLDGRLLAKEADKTIESLRKDWDEQIVAVESPNNYTPQELATMSLRVSQGIRDVIDLRSFEQTVHMRQISARLQKIQKQQENDDKVIFILATTVFLLLLIYFIKHVPGGSTYVRTMYYLFLAGVFTAGGSVLLNGVNEHAIQQQRKVPVIRSIESQEYIDFSPPRATLL